MLKVGIFLVGHSLLSAQTPLVFFFNKFKIKIMSSVLISVMNTFTHPTCDLSAAKTSLTSASSVVIVLVTPLHVYIALQFDKMLL